MNLQHLKLLHAYNAWANSRVFEALRGIPHEQYLQDVKGSHQSIHGTMTHLVGAEKIWIERIEGAPEPFLKPEEVKGLADLFAIWEKVGFETARWLGTMSDKKLGEVFEMKTLKGETFRHIVWQAFLHMINHSTYHRGQVTTIMRQLGHQPAGTDLIVFLRETVRV